MSYHKPLYLLILCCLISSIYAQDIIYLNNPSFEDYPRSGQAPRKWYDCGFRDETPPDIQPALNHSIFGVTKKANHQQTYIGMVVRDNNTWEFISQRLNTNSILKKNHCYTFSIFLARSPIYSSTSRITNEPANYDTPCIVNIWGGNSNYCHRDELLARSSAIEHTEWEEYNFSFNPQKDYKYITIEVYYHDSFESPYNGNVLMDNASNIVKVDCETVSKN